MGFPPKFLQNVLRLAHAERMLRFGCNPRDIPSLGRRRTVAHVWHGKEWREFAVCGSCLFTWLTVVAFWFIAWRRQKNVLRLTALKKVTIDCSPLLGIHSLNKSINQLSNELPNQPNSLFKLLWVRFCSSRILKRALNRYQDAVLLPWLEFFSSLRGTNSKTSHFLLSCFVSAQYSKIKVQQKRMLLTFWGLNTVRGFKTAF